MDDDTMPALASSQGGSSTSSARVLFGSTVDGTPIYVDELPAGQWSWRTVIPPSSYLIYHLT